MANEKRLIDASELEAHFRETKMIEIFPYWKELSYKTQCELVRFGTTIKKMMQNAPTVDAVEVVHGRWEKSHGIYSCSVCGKSNPYEVLGDNIWYWPCNYCPNCGADMRDGDGNG